MENCNKVVVSLSGGLDSTCVALHYLARGYEVRGYAFDYGQKHQVELKKLRKNIKYMQSIGLKINLQVINLRDVFSESASALVGHGENGEIPHEDYRDENQKITVVENRNVIFSAIIFSKALAWANKTGENVIISQGVHSGDHSIYPDCRPESVNMAKELYKISNWGTERVDFEAPFVGETKGEALRDGLDAMKTLGLTKAQMKRILKNTHSCYDPDETGKACGLCGTCRERLEAFALVGFMDPAAYVDPKAAKKLYDECAFKLLPNSCGPSNN